MCSFLVKYPPESAEKRCSIRHNPHKMVRFKILNFLLKICWLFNDVMYNIICLEIVNKMFIKWRGHLCFAAECYVQICIGLIWRVELKNKEGFLCKSERRLSSYGWEISWHWRNLPTGVNWQRDFCPRLKEIWRLRR